MIAAGQRRRAEHARGRQKRWVLRTKDQRLENRALTMFLLAPDGGHSNEANLRGAVLGAPPEISDCVLALARLF